jgi:hypothetical protein
LIIDGKLTAFAPAGLTSYIIPDNVTTIAEDVFNGCENLISITIPESVIKIKRDAFSFCNNLAAIYCKAPEPPIDQKYSPIFCFYRNADERKIYVPMESAKKYRSHSCWSEYIYDIVGYDFKTNSIAE